MRWWTQVGDYILTQRWVWFSMAFVTISTIIQRGSKMFENILEKEIVIGIAFVAVLLLLGLTQWSQYVQHQKKHAEDDLGTEKFAIIPYLVIPILGAVVTTLVSALAVDIAIGRGYITGTEEIAVAMLALDVVLYCLADYYLLGHVGDATYYKTIEAKVADAAKSAAESDDKEMSKDDLVQLLAQAILKK